MGKAFLCKSNGGGGGGLAFRVIGGTSAPSNPKPNDIWVNTDEEITSYIFSATEPEGYAEGMVWISTGTSSTAPFNALKKNGIQVYPLFVKQHISGAWVDKTAKTYQNGAWVNWWNGELYTSGNEWAAITGGWEGIGWAPDSDRQAKTPTVTKTSNYIKAYMPSGHSGGVLTPAVDIDLTNFTTLTIRSKTDRTSGLWLELGVIKRGTTYWFGNFVASVSLTDTTSVRTYNVDISALSGSYCVGVFINPGSSAVNFEMYELVLS